MKKIIPVLMLVFLLCSCSYANRHPDTSPDVAEALPSEAETKDEEMSSAVAAESSSAAEMENQPEIGTDDPGISGSDEGDESSLPEIVQSPPYAGEGDAASQPAPVTLPDRAMVLRVIDKNGTPVVNAQVALIDQQQPFSSPRTNADGDVFFNTLYLTPAGTYTFRVDMPHPDGTTVSEEIPLSIDLTTCDPVVVIQLTKETTETAFASIPNRLDVTVVDETGLPVPNVLITVQQAIGQPQARPTIGGPDAATGVIKAGYTNHAGKISFVGIPIGEYTLILHTADSQIHHSDFTIEDDKATNSVTVEIGEMP